MSSHLEQHGTTRPSTTTTSVQDSEQHVTHNTGRTVPDDEAAGKDAPSLASWYKKMGIDTAKRIQLLKIAHIRYQHPDLDVITKFLENFGMIVVQRTETEVWYRGYGNDQYCYYVKQGEPEFLGGTFEVESEAELSKASKLPGASEIQELSNAPGGGRMLTLLDPEGFPVNLMFGQQPAETLERPAEITYNSVTNKPRIRQVNRFKPGPAAVHKLGHYGLSSVNFEEQLKWYTHTFNFAPTDFIYINLPGENGATVTREVAMFAHIDRGTTPVDHHTFFLSGAETSHVHHSSFEVHDFDTQHLGHEWLSKQGYEVVWGLGRHVLGSQIFDYWWDTSRNMIEHYADGDLVNEETPIAYSAAGHESLAVWGPDAPAVFLQ